MADTEITQGQVAEAETPAPAEPDWKAEYEKVKPIVERAESLEKQYKGLQRQLEKARSENVSKADLTALEDRLASAMDALVKMDDLYTNDEPKRPPRPSEILKAARPKEEPKSESTPGFVAKDAFAQGLMEDLGYTRPQMEAFVQEFPELDEGLTELKKRYNAKLKKEAAEEALQTFRQGQKATGATKGDGVPSAAGMDDDDFLKAHSEGRSNDHARARKLLGL